MASHGASGCRDDEMPEGTVRGRDAGASRCRNSEEIGSEQDGCPGASMARGDGRAVVWKVALGAMMTKMRFRPHNIIGIHLASSAKKKSISPSSKSDPFPPNESNK